MQPIQPSGNNFFWTRIVERDSRDRELWIFIAQHVHVSLMHILASIIEKCSLRTFSGLWGPTTLFRKIPFPIVDPGIQQFTHWICAECGRSGERMNKCTRCYLRFCCERCNKASWKNTHKIECPVISIAYELAGMIRSDKAPLHEPARGTPPSFSPASRYGMVSDAAYHTLFETLSPYKEQERPFKHLEQRTAVLTQHQRCFLTESYLLTRELQPISEPGSLLCAEFLLANFLNPSKSPIEGMNLHAYHIRQSLFSSTLLTL